MFVPGKPFQPSLMFADKVGDYLWSTFLLHWSFLTENENFSLSLSLSFSLSLSLPTEGWTDWHVDRWMDGETQNLTDRQIEGQTSQPDPLIQGGFFCWIIIIYHSIQMMEYDVSNYDLDFYAFLSFNFVKWTNINGTAHFLEFPLNIEGTTEKVLQFKMPLKSIYNKNLGFIEQIKNFKTLQKGSNSKKSINWHNFCPEIFFSELPPVGVC